MQDIFDQFQIPVWLHLIQLSALSASFTRDVVPTREKTRLDLFATAL